LPQDQQQTATRKGNAGDLNISVIGKTLRALWLREDPATSKARTYDRSTTKPQNIDLLDHEVSDGSGVPLPTYVLAIGT
jgi:hypothetical protein